ncbi:MAG: heavy-metal-associated domain-containing protein [Thermoanaerobaculia bacterium]
MKRSLVFLVVFLAASAAAAVDRTVRFTVSGWTCGSCATASRIALKKLDGVEDVATNHVKKEAVVRYDEARVGPDEMTAVLARLGYKAVVSADRPAAPVAGSTSFFEVPLGCRAVRNLGCGSLATPILEELEAGSDVAEAWINHEGTVLAVVWKGQGSAHDQKARVEAAFQKNELDVKALTGPALESAARSFTAREKWYRGEDVADLSREEARVLAARLVKPVEKELGAKAPALKREFQAAFERCFIGGAALDREDFVKIALKYVGQTGVDKMEQAWYECFDDGAEPVE